MGLLPQYYFRIRDNGATVFVVDTENRNARVEMTQIATVNLRKDQVKPHGDHTLSADQITAIDDWIAARKDQLATRQIDDIHRTVDHLNLTTQWAQTRASDDDLDQITDALLLAMHDLRAVLVRKKAERLGKKP